MKALLQLDHLFRQGVEALSHLVLLAFRLYLAQVFLLAGLTKIANWETTLFLFREEYHVPLLPPELAAYMGTGAEFAFPFVIALGILTRYSAIGLFVFNAVALISYPDISEAGIKDHYVWGVMCLMLLFKGPGLISVDSLAGRFLPGLAERKRAAGATGHPKPAGF